MCSGTTSDIPISRLESLKKSVVVKFNKKDTMNTAEILEPLIETKVLNRE